MALAEGRWRRSSFFGSTALAAGSVAVLLLSGCKPGQQSAQQVKKYAAEKHNAAANVAAAASSAKSELKDISTGIRNSISDDDSIIPGNEIVNINYASEAKLMTLPGVSREQARKIMNNRPYNTPLDLVYKKVVTKQEYARIEKRVDAWDNLWAKPD